MYTMFCRIDVGLLHDLVCTFKITKKSTNHTLSKFDVLPVIIILNSNIFSTQAQCKNKINLTREKKESIEIVNIYSTYMYILSDVFSTSTRKLINTHNDWLHFLTTEPSFVLLNLICSYIMPLLHALRKLGNLYKY